MGGFGSWTHWLLVAVVVLIFFGGRGKISDVMGDFAKGIKAFKKGMSDDDATEAGKETPKSLADQGVAPAAGVKSEAQSKAG